METVFQMLKRKAILAHSVHSSKALKYETHGRAIMAYELGAITREQYLEVNTLLLFGKTKGGVSRETRN